jgi:PHS family inorganic phosphate transporter-like MFS transporter
VPGECFPTRYRSTSHGISAASGKLGAILAQVVFGPLANRGAQPGAKGRAQTPWLKHIMQIFALFMLCGLLITFLIPETKRKTLEELAGEGSSSSNHHPHDVAKTASVDGSVDAPPSLTTQQQQQLQLQLQQQQHMQMQYLQREK